MSLQIIVKNSSVSGKEPTASQLANGELALNYHADGPFITCKDTNGVVRRITGVWIGTTAPGTPQPGELWLDTNTNPAVLKVYKDGTDTWVAGTTVGAATTTSAGIVELATNAETQTGSDTTRAVTPASLQSKLSDSTSTTSSTTIASSSAVKSAYDLANNALPKAGGRITGALEIGPTGSLVFEGATDDAFELTLTTEDPTADRTITLPNVSGTVITTGDTGTVTNAMLAGSIADTKLSTISTAGKVSNSATTATSANTASAIVARDASGNFTAGTITANLTGNVTGNLTGTASAIADNTVTSAKIVDGAIVNADINTSAAIAGSKIAPDFGAQNVTTTGTSTAASFIPTSSTAPANGMYLSAANTLAFNTNSGTGRLFIGSDGVVSIGAAPVVGGYELTVSSPDTTTLDIIGGTANPCRLFFSDSTAGRGYLSYDHSDDSLRVGAASSERLRITSTGTVNIVGAGTAGSTQAVSFNGSAPAGSMVLDSSGRLGVGTSSPASNLEVRANSPVFEIGQSGATNGGTITWNNSAGTFDFNTVGTSSWPIVFKQSSTERARIDSSGRLLVGTSTNNATFGSGFQLVGTGPTATQLMSGTGSNVAGPVVYFTKSRGTHASPLVVADGDYLGALDFRGYSAAAAGFVQSASIRAEVDGEPDTAGDTTDMPGRLVFSTTPEGSATPSPRMTIDNSGRILIATAATPSGATAVIRGGPGGTNAAHLQLTHGTSPFGGGRISVTGTGGDLAFYTHTGDVGSETYSERLRVTSTGQVRLAGAGITFNGDTATANELDDYEEGTFTPTIEGTTAAGTGTYTFQVGRYTKVGNRVSYSVSLTWTAHTGTGNMRVAGLPFTSNNTANNIVAQAIVPSNLTVPAGTYPVSAIGPGATRVDLYSVATGGGAIANIAINTAATLYLSGHYEV